MSLESLTTGGPNLRQLALVEPERVPKIFDLNALFTETSWANIARDAGDRTVKQDIARAALASVLLRLAGRKPEVHRPLTQQDADSWFSKNAQESVWDKGSAALWLRAEGFQCNDVTSQPQILRQLHGLLHRPKLHHHFLIAAYATFARVLDVDPRLPQEVIHFLSQKFNDYQKNEKVTREFIIYALYLHILGLQPKISGELLERMQLVIEEFGADLWRRHCYELAIAIAILAADEVRFAERMELVHYRPHATAAASFPALRKFASQLPL